MENGDEYQLSTWGGLWRYAGIETHSNYGFLYSLLSGKIADVRDFLLYYLGLSDTKPPLVGESSEDFYIRKIYSYSSDCFNRPICGPPERLIAVGIRKEEMIENCRRFVLKDGVIREALNFGSYNYLGFGGRHPIITKQVIDCLKKKRCCFNWNSEFLHKEDAIVVPMGFGTNSTLIPILFFSDALNHTSIITGIRSSEAEVKVFKHNDMYDFKQKLEDLKTNGMKNGEQPKKVLVIVEGLYSMEGEYCPLKELIALKKAYGFYLYVDEAHSIGALGETGRGIVEHLGCNFNDIDILMGTFSKSFSSSGGYLASDKETITLLRSQSYSYVYGAPMSPICAQQIISSFEMMKTDEGKQRIAQLRKSSIKFRQRLKDVGCHVLGDDDSPVIPVMYYHTGKIKDISRGCLKRGVAVVVVGFPACPPNACRVRLCISASHTDDDIDKAFNVLMECLRETDSIFGNATTGNIIYYPPKVDLAELEALPKNPRKMEKLGNYLDTSKNYGVELSSYDIYGLENDVNRKQQLINTLTNYGCGSCGPRGFYGTTLEHLNLEKKLAQFYGTNDALTYSYGNNTMTSVVPVYGRQGDIILVDEKCNYNIQLGCRLSKAKKIKYNHLIVTEGVFQDDLQIAPLRFLSSLRQNNVLLIVDDSLGIGAIGENLKGTVEHVGLTIDDVDVLCGSLENVCSTIGGFCVGKFSVIDRQRLFGVGYCFSAAAPPFSCTAGKFALDTFMEKGNQMKYEIMKKRKEFDKLMKKMKGVELVGDKDLPFLLLNTRGKNEYLTNLLRKKGIFAVTQQHIDDDWCTNNYIRINIRWDCSHDVMNDLVNTLSQL
ncbi:serine C-palmitoyltransferase [Entamoeba marina]